MPRMEYRPIPSFPGYYAGEDGVIYSTRRSASGALKRMKSSESHHGYRRINLHLDGVQVKVKVSRLVCEAFYGPCPSGKECSHLNGVNGDDRPTNLRWETRLENMRRRAQHPPKDYNLLAVRYIDRAIAHVPKVRGIDEARKQAIADLLHGLGSELRSASPD